MSREDPDDHTTKLYDPAADLDERRKWGPYWCDSCALYHHMNECPSCALARIVPKYQYLFKENQKLQREIERFKRKYDHGRVDNPRRYFGCPYCGVSNRDYCECY